MKLTRLQANFLLLLTAFIWGTTYTMIKTVTHAGMAPGMINGFRGLIFLALIYIVSFNQINHMTKAEFKIGLAVGLFYVCVVMFQTTGLRYTTPSNSAFLTASYVVMVPFMVWAVLHHRPRFKAYFSTVLCLIGVIILTGALKNGLHFHLGDVLSLCSAVFCSLQIVYLEYSAAKTRPMVIAFMTALVQTIVSVGYSLLFETNTYASINWKMAVIPLVLLGIFGSFVGQTLQVISQRFTDSISAGLILMLESVFASIFSVALGVEPLSSDLLFGGGLIFLSLLISQFSLVWLIKYLGVFHKHHYPSEN